MQLLIKIDKKRGGYKAEYSIDNSWTHNKIKDMKLGKDDPVVIDEHEIGLEKIVEDLLATPIENNRLRYELFQLQRLGQYLYDQLFGEDKIEIETNQPVELRIHSDDEFIKRIPWSLLNNGGDFFCANGWSVILSQQKLKNCKSCLLRPTPRILIIAPEPAGIKTTHARQHLEELEIMLSGINKLLKKGENVHMVYTWDDFRQKLREKAFDIVYYYGHGDHVQNSSTLLFANGEDRILKEVPIIDVAQAFKTSPYAPPQLIYLNCCYGDAGGVLGAGIQLEKRIPAVITNRTVAMVDAAQKQAKTFFKQILVEGDSPHQALAYVQKNILDNDMSLSDIRWMTPVLHAHYDTWEHTPPKQSDIYFIDPNWHLKIDRTKQWSTINTEIGDMLSQNRPRTLFYVWFGEQGQGIELFHKRLKIEFQQRFHKVANIYAIHPEWPRAEIPNYDKLFKEMICYAFSTTCLEHIPNQIRAERRKFSNNKSLIYVSHEPIKHFDEETLKIINPGTLIKYINWWEAEINPLLEKAEAFAIVGISFVPSDSIKFRNLMNRQNLKILILKNTVYQLLDEMGKVLKEDLMKFLHFHDIKIPHEYQDDLLQKIIDDHDGHYELTVGALEELQERIDEIIKEKKKQEKNDDDFTKI
jgi:hypothetical protein